MRYVWKQKQLSSWNQRDVCGGFNASTFSLLRSTEFLNPLAGNGAKWKIGPNMNIGRYGHTCTGLSGAMYCMGGSTFTGPILSSVEKLDPAKSEWEIVASMNVRRTYCVAQAWSNKIVVAGGLSYAENDDSDVYSLEVYDPKMNEWTVVVNTPRVLVLGYYGARAEQHAHLNRQKYFVHHLSGLCIRPPPLRCVAGACQLYRPGWRY